MDIGIDIIEIGRIDRILRKYPKFRNRIFTKKEVSYCEQKNYPPQHYAARFAAKESIMKTLGTGRSQSIRWRDLEVVKSPDGVPQVNLHGAARKLGAQKGIKEIKISFSHCKAYAVAVAHAI